MTRHEIVHDSLVRTLPLFEMMRMRVATTARRDATRGFASDDPASGLRWVNRFTHTKRLLDANDREVVSPNNDTLYSNAWLDLADDAVVVETPEMGDRYWTLGLLDAWTNPFAYIGRRTTGSRPQRTLIHGPRWQGAMPSGITHVIAAPGDDVWIIGRMLVDRTDADLAVVHALQARLAIVRPDGAPATARLDASVGLPATGAPSTAQYVAAVDEALRRNPPAAGEAPEWPLTTAEIDDALPALLDALRERDQPHDLGAGWGIPLRIRTDWGRDYLTRARVARNLIGALGIEEAMYPLAEVDGDGVALSGAHAYELRFAPGAAPQVDAFWSMTMYRRADCLFVDNAIGRYSIGDRTPGLRRDADGSLVVRIQADDPGPAHNWLPAPAGDLFYVVLRLYQPRAAHVDGRYAYPPIRRL